MNMKATKRLSDEATKGQMRRSGMSSPSSLRRSVAPSLSRTAFSFTEVLFAVIILGIGFIMVAAMFPVAIQQTKLTADEGHAATIARGGVSYLQQIAFDGATFPTSSSFPPTPGVNTVQPLTRAPVDAWSLIRGNLILPDNPRYAFVPFYRRAAGSNTAQIYVIAVEAKTRPDYRLFDHSPTGTPPPLPNLYPRRVVFDIANGFVVFDANDPSINVYSSAAAEGAYLIISEDNSAANTDIDNVTIPAAQTPADQAAAANRLNGRIYRLGNATDNPLVFELYPGFEFNERFRWDDDGLPGTPMKEVVIPTIRDGVGYIVGKTSVGGTPENPGTSDEFGPFEGTAQDIFIYTTFIQIQ